MKWWHRERRAIEAAAKRRLRQFDAVQTQPRRGSNVPRRGSNVPRLVSYGVRPFDADIATALAQMRALARNAYENDGFARRVVRLARVHVVGPRGLRLRLDGDHAADVLAAWAAHSRVGRFDATGTMSRGDIERAALASLYYDGEAFVELADDGTATYIDAARVPIDVWAAPHLRMGIEYDGERRPVRYAVTSIEGSRQAYHMASYRRDRAVWIPAENMAHIFDASEFGEASRGVPRLYAALEDGIALREYRTAELQSAKAQAKNRGFLVDSPEGRNAPRSDARRVNADGAAQTTAVEADDLDAESILYRLPNGVSYMDATGRHPNPQYVQYLRAQLQAFGAATDTGFSALANDISGANFSSLRSERLLSNACYEEDAQLIAERLTRPVFERWLRFSIASGELAHLPLSAYSRIVREAEFAMPAPANLQPREEERARELRLALGVTSPQQEIAAMGGDPERVLRERAAWAALEAAALPNAVPADTA